MNLTRKYWGLLCLLTAALAAGCSSASSSKKEEKAAAPVVPFGTRYRQPAAKIDPNVVEETDTYYVTRYKKSEVMKLDDEHFRLPVSPTPVRFFKQDESYYYVRTEKLTPEEIAARTKEAKVQQETREKAAAPGPAAESPAGQSAADFENLAPPRASRGVAFVRAGDGLPKGGEWRQNIAIADMNGDGIPDIVTPPARHGLGKFHVFLGDGHGNFKEQPVTFVDAQGRPQRTGVSYGGVAVADFDGDGKPDVAVASHAGGVRVFLQREGGKFQPDDRGLPKQFSSQAIVAADVDGDGRPDLVVSGDAVELHARTPDMHVVRVYLNDIKGKGWTYAEDALRGAFFSDRLFAARFNGAAPDILTGSNTLGALVLTWKNDGKGRFESGQFDAIERYAFHQAVAPGTLGSDRAPAFADLYFKFGRSEKVRAAGINVYVNRGGSWSKIPVWREKGYRGRTTSVAMGDLNGDGLDDIVFPDREAGKLRIFYQTSAGRFEEAPAKTEPALDSPAVDVRLADLNGDGRLDIVLAKTAFSERSGDPGGLEVLLNQGP